MTTKIKLELKEKKMAYIMHLDWKWILQRPQYLAMGLQSHMTTNVIYMHTLFVSKGIQKHVEMPLNYIKGLQFRGESKLDGIKLINKILCNYFMKKVKSTSYDFIWLTSPSLVKYIDNNNQSKVIYDCMDDNVAMNEPSRRKQVGENEKMLVQRADLVIVSSEVLYDKMLNLKKDKNKVILIRNGYNGRLKACPLEMTRKDCYKIGYVGTISEWFDFSLILHSVVLQKNISYYLIGPNTQKNIENKKIHYEGTVEHHNIYNVIKDYDCLIMPFILNDLILAVDPVKLYEYISFGKCIISVYYPEISRFEDYVYFYKNENEYMTLLDELVHKNFSPKYSKEQQIEFLNKNTWDLRTEKIIQHLSKLCN